MARMSMWDEPVEVEVPAEYLTDVTQTIADEIKSYGEGVRDQYADQLRDSRLADVSGELRSLESYLRMFDQVRDGVAETTITGTRGLVSQVLQEMVGPLAKRLEKVAIFGPAPMGSVLDVAAELRWVAEEAIRIDPRLVDRLDEESMTIADEMGA